MVHLNVSQVAPQVDMLRNPSRLLPAEQRTLLRMRVEACDQRDGVKDGIINEPRACRFDPAALACKTGDAPDCLTPAQVENARSAWAAATTKSGAVVYPGLSPGFESAWRIPEPGASLNPLFTDMPRYVGRQDPM